MKKEFDSCPQDMEAETYGFSWQEFITAIPSPLVLVTSYKSNGLPNASMQSWCTFIGEEGFRCIFGSVNKYCHMYSSLKETGCCVINFPSADNFLKCYDTIKNNDPDTDEISASGLTSEPAKIINAPRVKECFLSLECVFEWEKDLSEEGIRKVICVKIVNIAIDEKHSGYPLSGRYGEKGYLYNIHSPVDPFTGEKSSALVGMLDKLLKYEELPE